ncbi:MAG: hypothetical protein O9972_09640 [Burkholderiales bacterium]|nr:hypothetical protein [Burkholderiales bacterium]
MSPFASHLLAACAGGAFVFLLLLSWGLCKASDRADREAGLK